MKALDTTPLRRGWEVARTVLQGLRSPGLVPAAYPALHEGGVAEGSFHSYMLSALLLLGHRLGYSAVLDSPVFDRLDNLLLSEGSKRPDSVWFERGTETVRVLIEFEKYTANSLESKARNLVLTANACAEDVTLVVLMYWTTQVRSWGDLRRAAELARKGFRSKGSYFSPAACPMLIVETIVERHGERLTVSSFVAKDFVIGGENKDYVVEDLNSRSSRGQGWTRESDTRTPRSWSP